MKVIREIKIGWKNFWKEADTTNKVTYIILTIFVPLLILTSAGSFAKFLILKIIISLVLIIYLWISACYIFKK